MKTKITHTRNERPAKLIEQFTVSADGAGNVSCGIQFRNSGTHAIVSVYDNAEPETIPIPMSEMKPGECGVIVTATAGDSPYVGHHVLRVIAGCVTLAGGLSLSITRFTVRLLQPGESLTITVVADKPEPSPEPDDQFERLADGTRKSCDNCIDGGDSSSDQCNNGEGNGLILNHRGANQCAHPCWRPIEPETLDHALWHGTAAEIMEAIETESGPECGWNSLSGAIHGKDAILDRIAEIIASSDNRFEDDCHELAKVIVDFRDRLDLFEEVKDAGN
jgi:hypothetical protein